jgi:hypothetical protein
MSEKKCKLLVELEGFGSSFLRFNRARTNIGNLEEI